MSKMTSFLLHVLAVIIATVFMMGTLLSIAYFYELYTPPAITASPLFVITGATLIDGSGAPPLRNVTIIIGGDKVLGVQQQGDIPRDAELLRAEGMVVLPGLVDAALFFELPAGEELDYLSGEWAWEITRGLPEHRRSLLEAGVTTVQDLGSSVESILQTRSLIQSGELAGPRLVTAGPVLTAQGGYPTEAQYPFRLEETIQSLTSPEQGRQWTRELASRGVDSIHVCYSSMGDRYVRIAPEILGAIVSEAHDLGLGVSVMTSSLEEAKQAVGAGADALVGGVFSPGQNVDGELLRLMRQQETVYIPTLAWVQAHDRDRPGALATAMQSVRMLAQAGIPIVAGSGTSGSDMWYGHSLHVEMALLVEAGLPPEEVIRAATANAATLLRLQDQLGTVEKGKAADLVLLAADPLEDIRAVEQVRVVIQNGRVVVNHLPEYRTEDGE